MKAINNLIQRATERGETPENVTFIKDYFECQDNEEHAEGMQDTYVYRGLVYWTYKNMTGFHTILNNELPETDSIEEMHAILDDFAGDIEIVERLFVVEDSEPMTLGQHLCDSHGWTDFVVKSMIEMPVNEEIQFYGDFGVNVKRVK